MVQAAKVKAVEDLGAAIGSAKAIILADFTGLNVKDLSELRRICREKGILLRVVKNTLARRAFTAAGVDAISGFLEGPTAVAVSLTDEVLPAQILKKFADEYELPRLKGGYVQGRMLSAAEVMKIAALPSREVLLTQVVGTVQAPLRGLLNCLDASLRGLVNVLTAIKDKKAA